ncbi:phage tail protein [Photorhabdus temperata]|uniref:Phage tail collar domain-containing protein n=1 Tax=Photorhabdus temperata J3 TaxID=1389415 RepID=U7QVY8_PHOTE|nr:phage tail protein [Photorhabdus temperata]ERT10586.1 hypothetical protein O185_24040 [Photorhabdus temperata J3]
MNPKNDFKAFSISDNANVVSQEQYEESGSLLTGFPLENITTHSLNKVLRQSSTIASVVADFIAIQSGNDVLDDGDTDKLTAQLNRALEQKISSISNIPVGSPIPWPLPYPPVDYLICNGAFFNKLQYPKLAEAYPDGRLPDLRGEFIRGWDSGRNVDPSRSILSWQEGSYLVQEINDPPNNVVNFSLNNRAVLNWDIPAGNVQVNGRAVSTTGNFVARANFVGVTRPRNIAFNYIVRAE